MFVRDDASKPPLLPLHRGPYKEKFVVLQIRDKSDSVSMDRLKLVISASPVTLAVPPPQGRPCLVPPSIMRPPDPVCLSVNKVRFSIPVPTTKLRQYPYGTF